ncbi:MAG: hypothetical protein J6S41_07110, partial [Clostridia bacterium]|nr:hypothetical protein [Clostridia bacterium]
GDIHQLGGHDLQTGDEALPGGGDIVGAVEIEGIIHGAVEQKEDLVTFYLTVYEENEDGTWERTDGEERERAYGLRSIRNALESCGLEFVNVSAGYDFEVPDDTCGRWYITARKKA